MESHAGSMAYCFFEVDFDDLSTLTSIMAEGEWAVEAPAAPEGLWLGVPDYARDCWVWFGPTGEPPEWIDTRAPELYGRTDREHLAVVNYSEHQYEHGLGFRTEHGGAPDDDSCLFAHHNPDGRPSAPVSAARRRSVARRAVTGSATRGSTPCRGLRTWREDYLAFGSAARTAGDRRAELDGTDPQPMWDDGINACPAISRRRQRARSCSKTMTGFTTLARM
jgi:hypothetical protein